MDAHTRLWVRYHEANSILKHYERRCICGRSKIMMEARYLVAEERLWNAYLRQLKANDS